MSEPQKDIPTKGKQLATKGTTPKTKPGSNNPKQAEAFSTHLKDTVDLFEARIHTYDRYETEKACPEFVSTYHKLLSEVEDYYKHAILNVVLDIIPDKMAKMMRLNAQTLAPVLTMFLVGIRSSINWPSSPTLNCSKADMRNPLCIYVSHCSVPTTQQLRLQGILYPWATHYIWTKLASS